MTVIFLSFEAESYMFKDLHDWLMDNFEISSFIVNCDASSFVNHSSKNYYPDDFQNYITLASVYEELHQNYNEIDFKYIEYCEREYGNPKTLNELLMSHQDINVGCRFPCATPLPYASIKLKYLELTFRWAEKIIEDKKPSLVFTLERNYFIKNMMFQICRRRGIPFKTLIASRVGKKHYVSDHFGYGHLGSGDELLERYRSLTDEKLKSQAGEAGKRFVEEYVSGRLRSPYEAAATSVIAEKDRMLSYSAIVSNWWSRSVSDARKALKKKKYRGRLRYNWMDNSPIRKIGWRTRSATNKIKYRLSGQRVFSMPDDSFLKGRFVYWALHTLPESSTLTLTTEYDEIELIRFLRQKLPANIAIAVKENPNMLGDRPFRFYRDLKALPNVFLVDPIYPSAPLVRYSVGVAGISGTSLFEAAMYCKPSLAFGFPEFYPLVSCKGRGEIGRFAHLCQNSAVLDRLLVDEYVSACIACGYDLDRKSLVRVCKGDTFEHSRETLRSVIADLLSVN
jgi:hypothetical protein